MNNQRNRTTHISQSLTSKLAPTGTLSLLPQNVPTPTKEYVKYTPIQKGHTKPPQRIIEVVDEAQDPFAPPKFKYKKQPPKQVTEPVPIMHSPPKKLSKKEIDDTYIPPCISSWKNNKGYTIALDKRLGGSSSRLVQDEFNERHVEFAEALYLTEKAREEENIKKVEMKRRVEIAKKEKAEEEMRELALAMRRLRDNEEEIVEEKEQRERIRDERRRDREDYYRKQGHKGLLKEMQRERKRDVAEAVALGKKVESNDLMFDQRLFNQSSGVSSGFGDEGEYNVYDEQLFKGTDTGLYRAKKENAE
ncbi:Puff-specific protein Bx42 [Entamoeba marina]